MMVVRRRRQFVKWLTWYLGSSRSGKVFFIICISLFSITWMNLAHDNKAKEAALVKEALTNVANDIRYADVYRTNAKKNRDLKYILLWTSDKYAPFYYFGKGQKEFIRRNCSMVNCYVTSDRYFFDGDLTKFDAIAFNGRNLGSLTNRRLPKKRTAKQIYIYFNTESADNYPICKQIFDGFFNWTVTYRLDSDVPFPYIKIHDLSGREVGPSRNMVWEADMFEFEDTSKSSIVMNKTKAVAWFVSNCKTRSKRELFAQQLQRALRPFNLKVDIYGDCGEFKCYSRDDCDEMLEKEYYFYLALENSLAEDYVTEKILTAVRHNVIPIVYGGADYSRFLPPNSYLDGRHLGVERLAATINRLISTPKSYLKYFLWKSSVTYVSKSACMRSNICNVCEALNNKIMVGTKKVYKRFRKWWLPQHYQRCKLWM